MKPPRIGQRIEVINGQEVKIQVYASAPHQEQIMKCRDDSRNSLQRFIQHENERLSGISQNKLNLWLGVFAEYIAHTEMRELERGNRA